MDNDGRAVGKQRMASAVRRAVGRRHHWPLLGSAALAATGGLALADSHTTGPAAGQPLAPVIPLVSLLEATGGDGSVGTVFNGNNFDRAGRWISGAGDFNGDGLQDLVMASSSTSGLIYVVYGRNDQPFPAEFNLGELRGQAGGDGSQGFNIRPARDDGITTARFSVAAGDINGDGIDDLILRDPQEIPGPGPERTTATGRTYVLFGRTEGFPADFPLETLLSEGGGDGSLGFVLVGARPIVDIDFRDVASADVNGDGVDDVIISTPDNVETSPTLGNETFVFYGRSGPFPAEINLGVLLPGQGGDGSEGFVIKGLPGRGAASALINNPGDFNGDGIDDLLLAYEDFSLPGQDDLGATFAVFGRDTAQAGPFPPVFSLAALLPNAGGDGTEGFVMLGLRAGDRFGSGVTAGGDINGDGIGDFLVSAAGAPVGANVDAGVTYAFFGRDAGQGDGFPAVLSPASLLPGGGGDGTRGFVANGIDADDESGADLRIVGDVNGDLVDDLLIGAFAAEVRGAPSAGEAYLLYGRADGFPPTFNLATLLPPAGGDGSRGIVLQGIDTGNDAGRSISPPVDLNGDGFADIALSAPDAYSNGDRFTGQTYVIFGRP